MPKKRTDNWSLKKIIYVLLTIGLGKLLGFLAFELLTLKFVWILEERGLPVNFDQIFLFVWSPLPSCLYWILIYAGVIGGFFLGLKWWQIVYVEKRHWKNWKKRRS
jgi:hypothetical protein